MKQRTALIAASTVTAFTLVVVGAVAARAAQPSVAAPTPAPASSSPPDPSTQTAYIQQVNDYYQQREAAYQQHEDVYKKRDLAYQLLIRHANEQLQQAYRKMAEPPKQVRIRAQTVQTVRPTATPYAISPQNAAAIALAAAPGASLLATPELVNFQGTAAYEVRLDRGNIYVDAATGNVLYNGTTAPAPQTGHGGQGQPQPGNNNQGGGDDGNHGGGGGDNNGGGGGD